MTGPSPGSLAGTCALVLVPSAVFNALVVPDVASKYSLAFTVVAEYIPEPLAAEPYQSEAELERDFIDLLQSQAYQYLPLHSEADLLSNLRTQIGAVNDVVFSDAEWSRLLAEYIVGANDGVLEGLGVPSLQ